MSMAFNFSMALVVELGSFSTKMSHCNHQVLPDARIYSRYGIMDKVVIGSNYQEACEDYYVGPSLQEKIIDREHPLDSKWIYTQSSKNGSVVLESGLRVEFPIQNGALKNPVALRRMLVAVLTQMLHISRSRNALPIVFLIPPTWTKYETEYLTQIAFEGLNASGLYIIESPLATSFAYGSASGLVVDIGHSTTTLTPVIDNQVLSFMVRQFPIGGRDVEEYLYKLLQDGEDKDFLNQFKQVAQRDINLGDVRKIKHSGVLEFIANPAVVHKHSTLTENLLNSSRGEFGIMLDPLFDENKYEKKQKQREIDEMFGLGTPDKEEEESPAAVADGAAGSGGLLDRIKKDAKDLEQPKRDPNLSWFTLNKVRHLCLEVFFDPSLRNLDAERTSIGPNINLAEAIATTIQSVNIPARRAALWDNIMLAGGSSQLSNLKERLQYELGSVALVLGPGSLPETQASQAGDAAAVGGTFLSLSDVSGEGQAQNVKFRALPEWFTLYKSRPWDSAFLGGCIVGKLVFKESKDHVTKEDYNSLGPSVIHTRPVIV